MDPSNDGFIHDTSYMKSTNTQQVEMLTQYDCMLNLESLVFKTGNFSTWVNTSFNKVTERGLVYYI